MHSEQSPGQHKVQVTGLIHKQAGSINMLSKLAGALFLVITAVLILIIGLPGIQGNTVAVTFSLEAPYNQSVALVGDFNNWDPTKNLLKNIDGIWKATIQLKKGNIYTYNFLLDGTEMVTDPKSQSIDDGYGGESSVIEVK